MSYKLWAPRRKPTRPAGRSNPVQETPGRTCCAVDRVLLSECLWMGANYLREKQLSFLSLKKLSSYHVRLSRLFCNQGSRGRKGPSGERFHLACP